MQFELDADQQAIREAVESLLARHAGPARAVELLAKGEYDHELERALGDAGFLELARGEETGPLEAALLVEAAARAAGVAAVGAAALVAPWLRDEPFAGPIAMATAGSDAPFRYAAHARTLLVVDGDRAGMTTLEPGEVEAVRSTFGFPMGRVAVKRIRELHRLPCNGGRLRAAWRVALAVELAGTMAGALEVTLDYVKKRRQFGRAIGSFQAVQHRLAECWVRVQGSRWLALEAAWNDAPEEAAALAAAHAAATARRVFAETHQFSGAMGFTRGHDLHVWSMRLQALRLELDGAAGHCWSAAGMRWVQTP